VFTTLRPARRNMLWPYLAVEVGFGMLERRLETKGFQVARFEVLELKVGKPALKVPLRVVDKCDQALKGVWWMSWHREATKDVVACDMLREAGKQASIRRFLNAETRLG